MSEQRTLASVAYDDSEAMRRFAQIDLLDDRMPDETTILHFRHLLSGINSPRRC